MLDYLQIHSHRPVQLGEVAAALQMNASYLSSLFSATMGMSFHHYLEELRLTRARELLRDPTRRISEVASDVGYSCPSHFWRAFKAHVGFSPRMWRDGEGEPSTASF